MEWKKIAHAEVCGKWLDVVMAVKSVVRSDGR